MTQIPAQFGLQFLELRAMNGLFPAVRLLEDIYPSRTPDRERAERALQLLESAEWKMAPSISSCSRPDSSNAR